MLRLSNRLAEAAEFGQLAVTLCQKAGDKVQTVLVYQSFGVHSGWLKQSLRDAAYYGETSYRYGIEVGEPRFASFGLHAINSSQDFLCRDTAGTIESTQRALHYTQKNRELWVVRCLQCILWHNLVLSRRGEEFDDRAFLASCKQPTFGAELAMYYAFKSDIAYLQQDYHAAWEASCHAKEHADHIKPFVHWYHYMFYRVMIALELWDMADHGPGDDDDARAAIAEWRATVDEGLQELARAAAQCPENFAQQHLLIQARQAQLNGDDFAAVQLYEEAVKTAQTNGYTGLVALANELCGRLWLAKQHQRLGRFFISAAYRAYQSWGAQLKVHALREQYAVWLCMVDDDAGQTTWPRTETFSRTEETRHVVDSAAVVKASQIIAQATRREDVIDRLVEIAVEAAGAERGLLISEDDDTLVVECCQSTNGTPNNPSDGAPHGAKEQPGSDAFSRGIVMYTMRTKTETVLHDAVQDDRFASDPYVATHKPRALLCLPVFYARGRRTVLYLENNLLPGVFSPKRLEVVRLLAAQAMISLDNALLYAGLEDKVRERTSELQETQNKLLLVSRAAGQADVATNMLHNVGNTLTGATTVAGRLRETAMLLQVDRLEDVVDVLAEGEEAARRASPHASRHNIVRYLRLLNRHLLQQRQNMVEMGDALQSYLAQIATTVTSQREYLQPNHIVEQVSVEHAIEGASVLLETACRQGGIIVTRQVPDALSDISCDRHKLIQIMHCVLENAVEALEASSRSDKHIAIQARSMDSGAIEIAVVDNGIGIERDKHVEIFRFGYTSKANRHGFGLHMGANFAAELGGRLWAESEGPGHGARFVLQLPQQPQLLS